MEVKMRVCVLSDEVIEDFDPGPFLQNYEWEMVTMKAPVLENLRAIAEQNRFDVYLNICEGYDIDEYEYEYEYYSDGESERDCEPETDQMFEPGPEGVYEGIEVVRALET